MSPDGSTKPPPEEKLLQLIRAKSAHPEAATAGAGATVTVAGVPMAAGVLRSDKPRFRWPKLLTIGLSLLLAVEGAYLVIQLVQPVPTVSIPEVTVPTTVEVGSASPTPLELPSLSASASHPLFAAPLEATATPTVTPQPVGRTPPSDSAKGLSARLTLMGIVAGDPPQAIIEDAQTKKTFFVTPGQPVVDGAMLEQVLDNRVILDFDGEKIELSL